LFLAPLLACPPLLKAIEKYIFPLPGDGPSEKAMARGFLELKSVGIGAEGAKVNGSIIFPNDPGYKDTARMLVETGLSLSLD